MGTDTPTSASQALSRAAGAIALVAILVGAASWSQPHVDGSDLWWHLAAGRYIAEHGEIPRSDPFSHTAAGQRWIDHSWLWGRIFWAAYDGHADLAAWLNLSLIVALFALVAGIAWRSSRSLWAAGATTWLVAASCHWFLDVRPHLVTLLLSAALLATLDWRRAPWLWPACLALWANLHGGFVFGLGLIGLWALVQSERALRLRQPFPRSTWIGVLCAVLAVGLNPWGFAIYAVPFQHIYRESPFGELIEWQATGWSLDPRSYAGRFWWLVAFALLGALRGKPARFSIALAIVTAGMAISARRFIPLFAISAAPLAALGIRRLLEAARRGFSAPASPGLRMLASATALLVAIGLWHDVRLLPRPLQRWTSAEAYPSGAVAYLLALPDPPQHLYNYYNWGGYLMLHAPAIPVFIDSRASTLYGDDLAADYFGMLDAEEHWREKLRAYAVDAVLVPPDSRIAGALRGATPAWRVAYIDPRSVLLFPPAGPARARLPAPSKLLPEGADLELSRGFRLRRRGDLQAAQRALVAAQRIDPLQLFAYGELMFVASLQGDADALRHWIDVALARYPRRWNPIWSFAEQAWGALGNCEARRDALREIRLGSPFVADALRDEIRGQIRALDCRALR